MSNSAVLFRAIEGRYNRRHDKASPIRLTRWNRGHLINAFAQCGFTEGAELGVREGIGALALCKAMPGLHLLCVDPWAPWHGHLDMQRHEDDPSKFLAEARERLAGYDCEFIQARSCDWAASVPNHSLDFVYIDGDHTFDGTMLDLILWAPKVKPGGILSGHEFKYYHFNGVIPAVTAYAYQHQIYEWYVTGDKDASWFWRVR